MKLELGKTYLTRKGDKVIIQKPYNGGWYKYVGILLGSEPPFNDFHYTSDGMLYHNLSSDLDLVSEVEDSGIQELSNSVQMLAKQQENAFLTDKERKDLIKSELQKLESLQSKINWRIMELNGKLKLETVEDYDDL